MPYEIIRKLDLFIGVTGNSKYSPDLQITTPGARYTIPQLALASKNLDFLTELYYMGANPNHKFSTLKGINRCENQRMIGEYSLFTTFNELFKMLNNFNTGVENLVFFFKILRSS